MKEAIKAAEKKDLSGYTDASVKAYKDVLEKAKAVIGRQESDGKDVEDILKALKDAEKLLVKKMTLRKMRIKNPDSQKGRGSSDRRSDTDHVLGVHAGSFRSCYFQKKKKEHRAMHKKSAQDNQILCADE